MQAGGLGPRKRPDRGQHPTTRHGIPDVFPCPEGGVHRCCMDRGAGALSPTHVPGYAMRTYSGRPSSSIPCAEKLCDRPGSSAVVYMVRLISLAENGERV